MKKMIVLFAAASVFTACKKDEKPAQSTPAAAPTAAAPAAATAVKVESISLGKAVDANKQVTEQMAAFAPTDTIHASVKTDGVADKVMLKAKWTLKAEGGNKVVHEDEQTLTSQGPAHSDFQLTKADGLEAGNYRVEILHNGAVATQKDFTIAASDKKPTSN